MTKDAIRKEARRRLEELSPTLQEVALKRAIGAPIIVWDLAKLSELERVIGATVYVRLVWEVNG